MAKENMFGLKEVADVWFVKLDSSILSNGIIKPIAVAAANNDDEDAVITIGGQTVGPDAAIVPAFIFDSLKVSNIETASEDTSARGGKGNPELISWSYNKEITFTMEDALLSLDTLHFMFGAKGAKYQQAANNVLTIDANSFPDSYLVIGKTVIRQYSDGADKPFVFVIPKAKIQANGTLTMEAEGDPSTFELTLKAMSASVGTDDGADKDVLVKFYSVASSGTGAVIDLALVQGANTIRYIDGITDTATTSVTFGGVTNSKVTVAQDGTDKTKFTFAAAADADAGLYEVVVSQGNVSATFHIDVTASE